MGSYQAGFSYYYTLALHAENTKASPPLRVVTGASAGSINALLAALSSCKGVERDPTQSIFYRTWIPVGMKSSDKELGDLADPNGATARSLLSPGPITHTIERVAQYFNGADPLTHEITPASTWLDHECKTDIGFVTTRVIPRQLNVQNGTSPRVTRQTEKVLLRFTKKRTSRDPQFYPRRPSCEDFAREQELSPDICKNADPSQPGPARDAANVQDLYPILGDNFLDAPVPFYAPAGTDEAEGTVTQVLRASATVPFAFPPTPLRLRQCGPKSCKQSERMTFVDGAVYENVPVRLAERLRGWLGMKPEPYMVILDTDTEGWKRNVPVPVRGEPKEKGLTGFALELAGNVLSSTMSAELLSAFEDHPALRGQCASGKNCRALFPKRRAPTAAGHFVNFLGFFDESFRIADFYMGMLDARAFVAEHIEEAKEPAVESALFACAKGWDEASQGFTKWPTQTPAGCDELSRVGEFDPGEERWQGGGPYDELGATDQLHFNVVRLFAAVLGFKLWTTSKRYDPDKQDEYWFKMLAKQGVESDVLVSESLGAAVRNTLDGQITAVAREQPKLGDRVAVRLLGRVAANYLDYREPKHLLSATGEWNRGFELGYGFKPTDADWFRLEAALRVTAFSLKATKNGGLESFTPSMRVRAVFPALQRPIFQLEPFIGYARQAAYEGRFERRLLTEDNVQVGLRFVLIQHAFLDVEVGTCVKRHRGPQCFGGGESSSPDASAQAPGQEQAVSNNQGPLSFSDVTINLGLGWRWLW